MGLLRFKLHPSDCSAAQESDVVAALIVVDVQNDFISGSLALSACEAKEVATLLM